MPLKRQRRPEVVAFGGVVVDHVEDDLDAGVVEALDHGLELADRAACQVARLGREEADRVVAPIVAQALGEQVLSWTKAWIGSSSIAVMPSATR